MIYTIESLYFYIIIAITCIVVVFLCFLLTKSRVEEFEKTFSKYKQKYISIMIDEENNRVELYYQFSNKKTRKVLSVDEFLLKFDRIELDKLLTLKYRAIDTKKNLYNEKIEIQMYDDYNKLKPYIVRLDSYDIENQKYYLTFKEIIDEYNNNNIKDGQVVESFTSFINNINEIKNEDDDTLVASISYVEHDSLNNNSYNYLNMVNKSLFNLIKEELKDNDYIYLTNKYNIVIVRINDGNEILFNKDLKKIVSKYSKSYQFNKIILKVSLLAGYKNIEDKVLEESDFVDAKNAISKNSNFYLFKDRVYQFNEKEALEKNTVYYKNEKATKIVKLDQFDFFLTPTVNIDTKKVISYEVLLNTNNQTIDAISLLKIAREAGLRKKIITKLFDFIILNNKINNNYHYYIPVDYQDLYRILDIYNNYKDNNLNITFIIQPIKNHRKTNLNSFTLLRDLKELKENNNSYHFALGIDNLKGFSFIDEIFNYVDSIIVSKQVVTKCLESFKNSNQLKYYISLSKTYNIDFIAYDVNNFALFEKLKTLDVNNMSGTIFNNSIKDEKIIDKSFIRRIDNI